MKLESWKLFLTSSICFLFASIMSLISKNFFRAIMFLLLGITYFVLSRTNYKRNKQI
jgi:predicted membrane protein